MKLWPSLIFLASVAPAQVAVHIRSAEATSDTVRLTVSVESDGEPARGLAPSSFRATVNGATTQVQKVIGQGSGSADDSLAMMLIIDTSGSSSGKPLAEAKRAVAAFAQRLRQQDEIGLIRASSRPTILADLTTNHQKVADVLKPIASNGRSALLDAIQVAAEKLEGSSAARKGIVILTDGHENASKVTATTVQNLLNRSDVLLFTALQGKSGKSVLVELSKQSGGEVISIASIEELIGAYSKLAERLTSTYRVDIALPPSPAEAVTIQLSALGAVDDVTAVVPERSRGQAPAAKPRLNLFAVIGLLGLNLGLAGAILRKNKSKERAR